MCAATSPGSSPARMALGGLSPAKKSATRSYPKNVSTGMASMVRYGRSAKLTIVSWMPRKSIEPPMSSPVVALGKKVASAAWSTKRRSTGGASEELAEGCACSSPDKSARMDTCGQRTICASWSLVIAEGFALGAFASPAESAREKHDATTSVKNCRGVVVFETDTMVTPSVATIARASCVGKMDRRPV